LFGPDFGANAVDANDGFRFTTSATTMNATNGRKNSKPCAYRVTGKCMRPNNKHARTLVADVEKNQKRLINVVSRAHQIIDSPPG